MHPLPRSFYDRNAIEVAPELLGKLLVHVVDGKRRIGRMKGIRYFSRT